MVSNRVGLGDNGYSQLFEFDILFPILSLPHGRFLNSHQVF